MKTGILTFHRAINYGAFLQAFATKTFLTQQGYEVSMVDYWPEAHARFVEGKVRYRNWRARIKQRSAKVLLPLTQNIKWRKMVTLQQQYLDVSEQVQYPTPASLQNSDFDCVIFGSDQIWWNHPTFTSKRGFDEAYFGLPFPNSTHKIAYAPSMGIIDIQEDDKTFLQKALAGFDALSVREDSVQEALQPLTNKPIEVVLDPVFLLNRTDWEQYIQSRKIRKGEYVLYYSLSPSRRAKRLAQQIAQQKHCALIEVKAHPSLPLLPHVIQTADSFDFISLIKNASFVVSTSFHGTAFSILFEKQFAVVGDKKRSGRMESLLNTLQIDNRITDNTADLSTPINYSLVTPRLEIFQQKSRNYLTNALNSIGKLEQKSKE